MLIQPSIDILDAQLHDGKEHVHETNEGDSHAADLTDFHRWLQEQNQSDKLNRFLSLQKEVNKNRFINSNDLKDKLNRTIEALKSSLKGKQVKHDL